MHPVSEVRRLLHLPEIQVGDRVKLNERGRKYVIKELHDCHGIVRRELTDRNWNPRVLEVEFLRGGSGTIQCKPDYLELI